MEAAAAPWWIWPLALFAVSFAIGIVAVWLVVGAVWFVVNTRRQGHSILVSPTAS